MGALHFPSPRMKPHSLRHGHVLPHVILQALALKKGGKVRRGAGVLRLKGRTINAPRLVVSLLRLACLVQRVPQFVLLVLRQLSMPVGVPLFQVVVQSVLSGKWAIACAKLHARATLLCCGRNWSDSCSESVRTAVRGTAREANLCFSCYSHSLLSWWKSSQSSSVHRPPQQTPLTHQHTGSGDCYRAFLRGFSPLSPLLRRKPREWPW